MEYASYVELGHKQQVGRYVSAIGKRLKQPWVRGYFMATISIAEIERERGYAVWTANNIVMEGEQFDEPKISEAEFLAPLENEQKPVADVLNPNETFHLNDFYASLPVLVCRCKEGICE